jgi:hypothetical protein
LARAKKIDLRITAIGLAVVLCLGAQAQEQAPALTAQDIQAASWGLQNYLDPELDMRKITMRDMTRILPDGSRGYVYMPDYEVGTRLTRVILIRIPLFGYMKTCVRRPQS